MMAHHLLLQHYKNNVSIKQQKFRPVGEFETETSHFQIRYAKSIIFIA
jgi:hypothetical protein